MIVVLMITRAADCMSIFDSRVVKAFDSKGHSTWIGNGDLKIMTSMKIRNKEGVRREGNRIGRKIGCKSLPMIANIGRLKGPACEADY